MVANLLEGLVGIPAQLATFFGNVIDTIVSLPGLIVDALQSVLEFLFVPDIENTRFAELTDLVNSKFPIVTQLFSIVDSLFRPGSENSVIAGLNNEPSFEFTYRGTTVSIIDFSMFESQRSFIHGIIIATSYYFFLVRLSKRLPGIIGGFQS